MELEECNVTGLRAYIEIQRISYDVVIY